MKRGKLLRLFLGNMFAGKTERLIVEIDTLREYGKKEVLVFKPAVDTRSGIGRIRDHHGRETEAFEIPTENPWTVLEIIAEQESKFGKKVDVLAFDEVQFFPASPPKFFHLISYLMGLGYDIMAAGLSLDFRGEPFGSTPLLTSLAQNNCVWLYAYCTKCGGPALIPQRLINGEPAPYDSPQVLVGGKDVYEARCWEHFVLPGRPAPPKLKPLID